jgi:hypothetical protein
VTGTGPVTGTGGTASGATGAGTGSTGTVTSTSTTTAITTYAGSYGTLNCTVQLPYDTIVVSSTTSSSEIGASFLVCAHKVLSYSGEAGRIFVENTADVVLNGPNNAVWLPASADLAAFQDPNTVVHEVGASITDDSPNGLTLIECATITYDLSLMPTGC